MTQTRPTDPTTARLEAAAAAQDWPLLVRLCRQTLRKQGRHLMAHILLGPALHLNGQTEVALEACRKAAALWPRNADLLFNYANLLLAQARASEALPLLEKAVELQPDHSMCWTKLAQCCYLLGVHSKGFDASQRARDTARNGTEKAEALNQLALHRRELGQIREAVQDCEQAIALRPDLDASYANCMLCMLADPTSQASDIFRIGRSYSEVFEQPLKPQWPRFETKDRSPWRRLRIGFVSPDFRSHSVMYYTEGMLSQLDRSQFEVFVFYTHPSSDHITTRVQCHADRFIHLSGKTPEQQAQAIQDADIDIAIDMAGHTGGNALLALAHKPAPVQLSIIGFPGTTGLKAVDWWISDAIIDPPDAQSIYTERLYRLPTRIACYRPMIRNPLWRYQPAYQVRRAPALENGYVTFGSCNNLGKVTDEVLRLWGRLLDNVPGSRLLIEGRDLHLEATAEAYRARCAALGIDTDRLDLVAMDSKNQYLTYHHIDIALDPFPLVGGATTNDVLWMGLPLVTLNGNNLRTRQSTSALAHLGRHEWIARNQEEYLQIAMKLAADIPTLNQLRQGLRQEVEASVVMREDVFAQEFGHALRHMWLHWLVQSAHPDWTTAQVDGEVQSWWQQAPEVQDSREFEVGVAPGERIPLSQAYQRLEKVLDLAKLKHTPSGAAGEAASELANRHWTEATELAERILCAHPHDAVALTVLAEIENAHGHLDFGQVYLKEALQSLMEREPPAQLLERTRQYVNAALDYLGEPHCTLGPEPPVNP